MPRIGIVHGVGIVHVLLLAALSAAASGCRTTDAYTAERATVGAGVGVYMDREEAKLREQLRGTGVSVTRIGDSITLDLPGHVTFKTDSADLNAAIFGVLDSVVRVAKEYDQTIIEAAGHTDSIGSEEYNHEFSERRARAVADYLRSHGIRADRLRTVGFGELRPIAGNDTAEGRVLNRRVELTFAPIRRER